MPKTRTFAVLVGVCWLLCGAVLGEARAQIAGRWELGRPPVHIDLPGEPTRTEVPWSKIDGAFIFPVSWKAEGNGVTLEAARIIGAENDPEKLLAQVEAKTGDAGNREKGEISGRPFLLAQNDSRLVGAIAPEPGANSSVPWVIVLSYANPTSAGYARSLWNSMAFEREGSAKPALRTLGAAQLIAEIPYDLAPSLNPAPGGQRRYEASWDGMSLNASIDNASGANMRWDTKRTIEDYIGGMRAKRGVSNFKAEKTGLKIGKLSGDMATLTFRQGTRDYKLWKVATFSGAEGYQFEFSIDPNRTDHILTVAKALETMRTTDTVVTGWKTHELGAVHLEAPGSFEKTKAGDTMQEWQNGTGGLVIAVRDVTLLTNAGHNPDALANQTTQVVKMLPNMQNAKLQGIDKRVVDGIPARLVRYSWQNAGLNNLRSQLFVYGYGHTYAVDVTAAPNYKDAHDRILDSVGISLSAPGLTWQNIGASGARFLLGKERVKTTNQTPPSPEIKSIEQAIVPTANGGVIAVIDQLMAEPGKVLEKQAASYYDSFAKELKSGPPTESHEIYLDGGRGYHLRGQATIGGATKNCDCLALSRNTNMLVVFIISNPDTPDREARDILFSSLRLGLR